MQERQTTTRSAIRCRYISGAAVESAI